MQQENQVRSYQDLKVWQKAMDMVEMIYKITNLFPKAELYGLTSQLRRAAVSIASNIAFLNIASGSVAELQTQSILSCRLGYVDEVTFKSVINDIDEIGRMLHGLYASLRDKLDADLLTT